SQSSTRATSQGSILLIEEYDALAAAITSALRKFAPAHSVQVARTLAEARTSTKTFDPELVVIDFDPPFAGLSAFLQSMQKDHPDTCALIIGGKLPPKIISAARSGGAVQFVEKPFDVQDFGAAVQALLGPWREAETTTPHGTLQDLTLADLIIAQCGGAHTVALEVTNGHGKSGEIHLRQGMPAHAEAGRKSGKEALREMLSWREVDVQERERPRSKRHTLDADWPDLFVEIFRRAKPKKSKSKPGPKAAGPATPAKPVQKLVVIDDTEMLLVFVEDVLTTSGNAFQITTAPNGLKGIKEIERIKPDLVLLDYSLPDINGDEVCRRLLQKEATARIPVLMMSGHVIEMSKAAATLDNVVATIEKPFRSEALVSLVQQVLSEQRPVRKKAVAPRKPAPAPAPATPPATPAPSTPVSKKERPPEPAKPEPVRAKQLPPPLPPPPPAPSPAPAPAQPVVETPAHAPVAPEQQALPFALAEEAASSQPEVAAPSAVKPEIASPPPVRPEPAPPIAEPSPVVARPAPTPPSPAPPPVAKPSAPLPAKPPIQAAPEPIPTQPEPRVAPAQSVVDKARRAIEHLRRQISPKEEHPSPLPPPRLPIRPPTSTVPTPEPSADKSATPAPIPEPVPSLLEPHVPLAPVPPPASLPKPTGPPFKYQLRKESPPPPEPPQKVMSTRVLSEGPNEVVLSVFLDVLSVQLTPELRMGSIRAKPSSGEVSLHVVGPAKIPPNGFKLGEVVLDAKGRIKTMRLIPTQVPFRAAPTQNSLQIGAVSVVPIDSTSRMQLTPAPQAPMTLRLLAHLELAGVELSPSFEISQIVLKDRGQPIRVTMNSHPGAEENGTACEAVGVRLDQAAHIAELLLNPVR
ncbi:MAG TPA: response regulator, partial [Chthoniobacterales bacterium]|nr:response regulator [Chthoniobacterales bacterium]